MAINKKLISFATQAQFDVKLNAGDIDNRSIVFIEDTKRIWTHGVYFDTSWDYVTDKPDTYTPSAHTLGSHSDVTITSNSNGEILKWNGSKWINNTLAEAGIASTGQLSNYLPLAGGTLTGSSYNMLELKRSSANGSSMLFSNSSVKLGKIGFTASGNLIIGTGASTDGVANMLSITPSGVAQFYGNISTSGLVTGTGFSKTGATDAHMLLGSGGHKAISDFNASLVTSTTTSGTTNVATSNTNTYLNIVQGGSSAGSSTQIMGSNGVSVSSNTSGRVTIAGVGNFRDYGLGSDTSVNKNPDDFGSMSSGFYGVSTGAVGNPVSGSSGTLIHLRSPASGNNYWAQLHLLANGATSPRAFISHGQTTRAAGWEELYHTGNIPTWNQSTTGNAATASAVSTSAENSSTASRYILFANNASGNQALKTDTGLKYVPSTNTISATFSGDLTGNVTGNVSGSAGSTTNWSGQTYNTVILTNPLYILGTRGTQWQRVNLSDFSLSGHTHTLSQVLSAGNDATNNIIISGGNSGHYFERNFKFNDTSGGWARAGFKMHTEYNVESSFTIGMLGSGSSYTYSYLGFEGYNSSNNLRIYPSGTVSATTFSGSLSGNADTATTASKLTISSSASTSWFNILWNSGTTVYGSASNKLRVQPSTGSITSGGTITASGGNSGEWNSAYSNMFSHNGSLILADVQSTSANVGRKQGSYTVSHTGFSSHLVTFEASGSTRYLQLWKTNYGSGGELRYRSSTDANLVSAWRTIWDSGNLANGTTAQYIRGDGSLATYTDTTYSLMTAAEASTGTATTARTISAKVLADEITRRGNTLYLPLTGGTLTGALTINLGASASSPLSLTSAGVTTSIGSLNSTWCHFNTTATTGFYFYKNIQTPLDVTARSFIGALSGNASSATYASAVTLTADNSSNATRYPLFVSAATGNLSPRTDTGFTYNPSTGILTSTRFAGSGASLTSLNATQLTTGIVPDARLSGVYTGFSHKINGTNTIFTSPSSGSDTRGRTVFGLAEYRAHSSTATGAIIFIAPFTKASTIMKSIEIDGMLYSPSHAVRVIINNYTGALTKKMSYGTIDIQVRVGETADGKFCVILGDIATTWSYPHFTLSKAMFSHSSVADSSCYGWTTALVTSLTGYVNISAELANSPIVTSITGNAATATKLGTATVGSTQLPIYLNAGTATAITQANLRKGLFGTTAIGSSTQPIYIAANGVPTAITGSIANSTTGNAATATKLASINTTFTGTYPVTVNVSGAIYSHTGLTFTGSTGALTATSFVGSLTGNASSASKVNNNLTLKFDSGTTENTNLYTYNGSAAKTIDIKAGSNVTLTKTANTVTISSTNTNTTYSEITTAETVSTSSSAVRLITGRRLKYAFDNITAANATNATNTTNINTLADNTTNAARFILFSDAATGNQRAKTDTGLTYNPSSNTITATLAGNATTATTATTANKVSNSFVIKFDTGTTENTNLYTFNGSAAKTINIVAGSNVSLSKSANTITINATDNNTTYPAGTKELILSGIDTTNRVWSGKTLKDWYLEEIDILLDSDRFTGSTFSSNVIDLTNVNGAFNVNSVNNYTTYTLSNKKVRGAWARVLVNSSIPITVTGAKLINLGNDFELNTDMYLNVMYDGINTLGYYTKVAGSMVFSYYISTGSAITKFTNTNTPIGNFCNSISSVTIEGVNTIKNTIKDIYFSDEYSNTTSINYSFLEAFTSLTSVDLSSMTNVTSIGSSFLRGCYNLPSIDLSSMTNITAISDMFLYGCSKLISVDLSSMTNVTSIGHQFLGNCSWLTSVDLSSMTNVTSIGGNFLSYCTSLISVDLSSMTNLTSIGNYFLSYSGVKTLKMGAIVPPSLSSSGAFPPALTSILVPSAAVNAYKAAPTWSSKASIISGY